ncbi:metallophosphoesterase [Candidatus Aerophobetes bacterium]|nr:metallophosphoesterase [Candidatus Aerophobetes bacterium]
MRSGETIRSIDYLQNRAKVDKERIGNPGVTGKNPEKEENKMKEILMKQIKGTRTIEFLFSADLEVELHPNEDPARGVHTDTVLKEILKEVRGEGKYTNSSPPSFILFNGDTDARYDKKYRDIWEQLESLCPCYYVFGNHECGFFDNDANKWRRYHGYQETYYSWEYFHKGTTITFIVLDTWCAQEGKSLKCYHPGTGGQIFREEEKQWLKEILDKAPGLTIVFAHAHMWCPPKGRTQDNKEVDELLKILKGTYEEGKIHRSANIFFNGGHHDYPSCEKVEGIYFIDPLAGIHKAYARVIIDPINKKMDYIGRFNEKSYLNLNLS